MAKRRERKDVENVIVKNGCNAPQRREGDEKKRCQRMNSNRQTSWLRKMQPVEKKMDAFKHGVVELRRRPQKFPLPVLAALAVATLYLHP